MYTDAEIQHVQAQHMRWRERRTKKEGQREVAEKRETVEGKRGREKKRRKEREGHWLTVLHVQAQSRNTELMTSPHFLTLEP